jgi:formylglycine-generating enzyme required for sulfatase activity
LKKTIVILVFLFSGSFVLALCPSADISGDCRVDYEDFAMMSDQWLISYDCNDLTVMASQWLTEGLSDPNGMVWVYINDPGVDDTGDGIPDYEPFNGYMSKYETTNAQYCQFLNAALASGDIDVGGDDIVYGANGSNSGGDFVDEIYFNTYAPTTFNQHSQITYSDGVFSVRSRDGYDMSTHPVVEVSWYGATAFCNYYGYRLPTEWEWQAVADYDGTFTYGCGTTINQSKANYGLDNPLSLSGWPYTNPVDHYLPYGYGMNDMADNVWEWTDSVYGNYRILRGGSWLNHDYFSAVSFWINDFPEGTLNYIGFRVCR